MAKRKRKQKRDWTSAKAAREAARAEKVRWLVEHGFNEHTAPAHFYNRFRDRGCPYTRAGLYRVRDTVFRGRAVPGRKNAGSVPVTPPDLVLASVREAVEREGTRAAESPAPPAFSMLVNAGRWR